MGLTEQTKLEIIREAIKTADGWKHLAKAVKDAGSKEECVELLRKLAGTKQVSIPVEGGANDPTKTLKMSYADQLVQQLEQYLAQLETMTK